MKRIFIVLTCVVILLGGARFARGTADSNDYAGENILYRIRPIGRAEYTDLGAADLEGRKVNVVMFRTKILFVEDTQKIYSDPESFLPYRIERTVSKLWGKEFITREYNQGERSVVIRRYKGKKLVNEEEFKAQGPIQNEILFPFYLRTRPDVDIGWQCTVRFPNEFTFELVSLDEITVPAGTFQTYHFKSIPEKFDIWINKDSPRVPVKIQGKAAIEYSLLMKEYRLPGVL